MAKIIYIAGWGRSGTTLLDTLLGQIDGVFSGGELHWLWQRGLIDGRSCGCGLSLRDCPVWQRIFDSGFGGMTTVDPAAGMRAAASLRTRDVRRLLAMKRRGTVADCVDYASYLDSLYAGIARATGDAVVVDSSKVPVDAIVAAGLAGHEVHVIHMVRDPRAVAYSWQRRKPVLDKVDAGGLLKRVGLVRSTVVWQFYNLVIALQVRAAVDAQHYMRISYESLVSRPAAVLAEILEHIGESGRPLPSFDGGAVELRQTHTAAGNPSRFNTGRVAIRLDSEWQHSMPHRSRVMVSLLAFPASWLFGYRRAR